MATLHEMIRKLRDNGYIVIEPYEPRKIVVRGLMIAREHMPESNNDVEYEAWVDSMSDNLFLKGYSNANRIAIGCGLSHKTLSEPTAEFSIAESWKKLKDAFADPEQVKRALAEKKFLGGEGSPMFKLR